MNAKRVKDVLTSNGIRCSIVSGFSYRIDKNRRFLIVNVNPNDVNCGLIALLDELECIAVVQREAAIRDGIATIYLSVNVYPRDMQSFDWED